MPPHQQFPPFGPTPGQYGGFPNDMGTEGHQFMPHQDFRNHQATNFELTPKSMHEEFLRGGQIEQVP